MPRVEAWFKSLGGGGESALISPGATRTRKVDLLKTGPAILPGAKKANDEFFIDYLTGSIVGLAEAVVTDSSDKVSVRIPFAARLRKPITEKVIYWKQVRADPADPFSREINSLAKTYPNDQRTNLYCVALVYGNRNPDHRLDEELGFLVLDDTNPYNTALIFWPYDRLSEEGRKIAMDNYRQNRIDARQLSGAQLVWLRRSNRPRPTSESERSAIPGGIGLKIG